MGFAEVGICLSGLHALPKAMETRHGAFITSWGDGIKYLHRYTHAAVTHSRQKTQFARLISYPERHAKPEFVASCKGALPSLITTCPVFRISPSVPLVSCLSRLLLLRTGACIATDVRVKHPHHIRTGRVGRVEPWHHVKTKHAHVHFLRFDSHVAERLHVGIRSHVRLLGWLSWVGICVALLDRSTVVHVWCRVGRLKGHDIGGMHVRVVFVRIV